jgi:hypothetical protein
MLLEYEPHLLPTIWPAVPEPGAIRRARRLAKLAIGARALRRLTRAARPVLSPPDVLRDRLDQLEERLNRLRASEILTPLQRRAR